ncbi:MAG: hypothetical protein A2X04_04685 [Bacteroidetes bacterium GWF2_41_9]|nr:MAG: hypothetical protein A2X03_13055 [Bacteroidetes bacterium GWA2_40_15]OFY00952.1 MAG: hypothetical protein A2X06_05115 [Bacteroidetes bacterium GWC2_40_22]OFY57175.1 MAG: hypothetical protein A2X04_04685 [Bacteroidetes bacterium GWF2_41_9]HAM11149.1 hypothetical protein [Bacteroidales bacterium]HBH83326.1 hypothetical protein [Bacteroidales bacterium]
MNDINLKGTYGYDVAFLSEEKIKTIELKDNNSEARILLVPAWQGRVMTSTVGGENGASFGWINYRFIEEGKVSSQFNPFGGEERLWLGPEGGPFSIYFREGTEQVFENWIVPKAIDTEPFDVVNQSSGKVSFTKNFSLVNASGTKMEIGIERNVKLLNSDESEIALGIPIDKSLSFVAYESENILINKGQSAWSEKTGALSVWMLAMFNPSPKGVVFIPFRKGSEAEAGKIVNDDYFGKVPSDRLVVKDGILFFRTDGKHRSKIGITPQRALPFCGSYDPEKMVLTLLWYSAPEKPTKYVNSKWGTQDDPFSGDAVNSYNDGPVDDGSIMGPFYEIESSSPAAMLPPGGKVTHKQRIFHITGSEEKLSLISEKLFNQKLADVGKVF